MRTSRNAWRDSSTARCASQPPSISTPVSQRRLPRMRCSISRCAAGSPRTSTRTKRSSSSCSQYHPEVRPSSSGAPAVGRGEVALLTDERFFFAGAIPSLSSTESLLDAYLTVQCDEMRDRVRVVGEKRNFFRAGAEQAVAFVDEMTQAQHAQADGEGIVEVAARDVDVRTARLESSEQAGDLAFQLEL